MDIESSCSCKLFSKCILKNSLIKLLTSHQCSSQHLSHCSATEFLKKKNSIVNSIMYFWDFRYDSALMVYPQQNICKQTEKGVSDKKKQKFTAEIYT